MYYTDNPVADYDKYSADQEEKLESLPVCSECNEHIQSEHLYVVNDEFVCPECMDSNHRKWVEDCVC